MNKMLLLLFFYLVHKMLLLYLMIICHVAVKCMWLLILMIGKRDNFDFAIDPDCITDPAI